MRLPFETKRRLRAIVPQLFGLAIIVYFATHAVRGDRGLFAYLALQNEIRSAEATRDLYVAERTALELRAQRLRADSLDLDLLDWRVREVLSYALPDEAIVLLPAGP